MLYFYELSGRKVLTPGNEFKAPGSYTVDWDAGNFGNGLYFYKLQLDDEPGELKKMVLAR